MISDNAVSSYYITPEKHAEHFAKKKAGLPSYDILSEWLHLIDRRQIFQEKKNYFLY